MTEGIVINALSDDNMGVILVANLTGMAHLKDVSKNLLRVARVGRLDLREEDKALFPSARPEVEKAMPWHTNYLHKTQSPPSNYVGGSVAGICCNVVKAERIGLLLIIRSGSSWPWRGGSANGDCSSRL